MKVDLVLSQDSKALKRGQRLVLNTNGRGLSSDVDSALLSVSHTAVTSTFQGQLLLSNGCSTASFCSRFMPLRTPPRCPNLRLTRVHMREFSQPEGVPLETEILTA